MNATPFAENLVRFINSHDLCRAVDNGDGTLSVWSFAVKPGSEPIESRTVEIQETLPAKIQAVRDWLGY